MRFLRNGKELNHIFDMRRKVELVREHRFWSKIFYPKEQSREDGYEEVDICGNVMDAVPLSN